MKRLHQTNKPFSPKKSQKTQKENTFFFCAFCDSLRLKIFIIHFALFIGGGAALHAQDTFRQQPDTQLAAAIALDRAGDHAAARKIYDTLLARHQSIWQTYLAARKAGKPLPAPTLADTRLLALSNDLNEAAALNHIFLAQYDKALSLFTAIHDRSGAPTEMTNRAALWRLWLAAKMRSAAGLRSAVAIDTLVASLNVTTPFHQAMLKFYQGKLPWPDVLETISTMQIDAPTRERYTTQAHLFAAGYYRYVKRDPVTALKLLESQSPLPDNGAIERLHIRHELKSLKKPNQTN